MDEISDTDELGEHNVKTWCISIRLQSQLTALTKGSMESIFESFIHLVIFL